MLSCPEVQSILLKNSILDVKYNEKVLVVFLESYEISVFKIQNMKQLKVFNLLDFLPKELFITEELENIKASHSKNSSSSNSIYQSYF